MDLLVKVSAWSLTVQGVMKALFGEKILPPRVGL